MKQEKLGTITEQNVEETVLTKGTFGTHFITKDGTDAIGDQQSK